MQRTKAYYLTIHNFVSCPNLFLLLNGLRVGNRSGKVNRILVNHICNNSFPRVIYLQASLANFRSEPNSPQPTPPYTHKIFAVLMQTPISYLSPAAWTLLEKWSLLVVHIVTVDWTIINKGHETICTRQWVFTSRFKVDLQASSNQRKWR